MNAHSQSVYIYSFDLLLYSRYDMILRITSKCQMSHLHF